MDLFVIYYQRLLFLRRDVEVSVSFFNDCVYSKTKDQDRINELKIRLRSILTGESSKVGVF